MSRGAAPFGFCGEWVQADLLRAQTLGGVLGDVDVVVHCASNVAKPQEDSTALQNLIAAARGGGTHILYVSICGIEDASKYFEYYRVKLANEAELTRSGLPHSILRISQFHPFVAMILQRLSVGPFLLAPKFSFQPIDVVFAGQELSRHAVEGTKGRLPDLHGPNILTERQLLSSWSRAHGKKRIILPIPRLGPMKALGALRMVTGTTGGRPWEQWLTDEGAADNPYLRLHAT